MATSRVAASSCTRKSGRYVRTGAFRSKRRCSTSFIIAAAVTVLEMEAMVKIVSGVTGWSVVEVGDAEAEGGELAVVEEAEGDAMTTGTFTGKPQKP